MSKELVFYTNPQSRGAIVHWMLEEIGCPYRLEPLEFGAPMQAPDYLAINPMGKVPAIRHGDQVVTEAAAICAYLADAFPEAGLAPEPARRGAYYRWLFFAAGCVEPAMSNRAVGWEPAPEMQGRFGYARSNGPSTRSRPGSRTAAISPPTVSPRRTSTWRRCLASA
jgi:glutathione S-transferase